MDDRNFDPNLDRDDDRDARRRSSSDSRNNRNSRLNFLANSERDDSGSIYSRCDESAGSRNNRNSQLNLLANTERDDSGSILSRRDGSADSRNNRNSQLNFLSNSERDDSGSILRRHDGSSGSGGFFNSNRQESGSYENGWHQGEETHQYNRNWHLNDSRGESDVTPVDSVQVRSLGQSRTELQMVSAGPSSMMGQDHDVQRAWTNRKKVNDEKKKLFSPYQGGPSKSANKSKMMPAPITDGVYNVKQVVLLKRNNKICPPDPALMHHYYHAFLVQEPVPIPKHYNRLQVRTRLAAKFPRHLLKGVGFDILKKEGNFLVQPPNDLDGVGVSVVFQQKKMYLRPRENLNLDDDEYWSSDDEIQASKKKLRRKAPHVSDNESDEDSSEQKRRYPKRSATYPSHLKDYNLSDDGAFSSDDYEATKQQAQNDQKHADTVFEKPSLSSEKLKITEKLCEESQDPLFINREDVWTDTVIGLTRPSFSDEKRLFIIFSDRFGREDGLDGGGLTQDFFTLNLEWLRKSDMFSGPEFERELNYSKEHNDSDHYRLMGKLFALSFAHNASEPQFLTENLYTSIILGKHQEPLNLQNVNNFEIQSEIQALSGLDSSIVIKDYLSKSILLNDSGINWAEDFVTKEKLINDLLDYYINTQLQGPFEALLEGMETLNFLTLLRRNPELWKSCFVKPTTAMTANRFRDLLEVEWSADESVKKDEASSLSLFFYFLTDLERGSNGYDLSNLLYFTTNRLNEPAGGFMEKITIKFLKKDGQTKAYPDASTCAFELYLPTWKGTLTEYQSYFFEAFKVKGCHKP